MQEQPSPQHDWLHQLIGDWVCESEYSMGPDQPLMKNTGTERVRSLGGLWTIGEGTMGADAEACYSVMTLGFNPRTQRFIGTFIASMMSHMWTYDGSLDASGKILTMDAVGPNFSGDGSMAQYQDIFEFVDANHRTFSSRVLLTTGEWQHFMSAHYYRVAT